MAVVTISAAYGAGGSEIGPRVAQRLGAEFVDRAIPVAVARDLGISVEEAEAVAENAPSRWHFFARASTMAAGLAPPIAEDLTSERDFLDQTETHLREVADRRSCVILGHAAAVALADRSDVLHVRLDGAPAGRIQAAMRQHGISEEAATAAQKENDKIRSGYVKHFYRADSSSPQHYHLVLDTVRLDWTVSEELIVLASGLLDRTS